MAGRNLTKLKKFAEDNQTKVEILIADSEGKARKPREWFQVPIQVIEEAISLIVNEILMTIIMSLNWNKS
jgi:hypothetical protein